MKKRLSIILTLIILLPTICILNGCSKQSGKGNTSHKKISSIELLCEDDYFFEYGENTIVPIAVAIDKKGNRFSYDVKCDKIVSPSDEEIEFFGDSFMPQEIGVYSITYSYGKFVKEFEFECKDTIPPTIDADVDEEYKVADTYSDYLDENYTVHKVPLFKTSDLSGVYAKNASVRVFLNDKEVNINEELEFILTESGEIRFDFLAKDNNGMVSSVSKYSEAVMPENFDEFVMSSFNSKSYLKLATGGWLYSSYEAAILDSYTDKNGETFEGVLKVSYPKDNAEAGLLLTFAKQMSLSDIDYITVTACITNCVSESSGYNFIVYRKDPFWENQNLPCHLDENTWTTITISNKDILKTMTGLDGETLEKIQFETLGSGHTQRTVYIADISYGFSGKTFSISKCESLTDGFSILPNISFSENGGFTSQSELKQTGIAKLNGEKVELNAIYDENKNELTFAGLDDPSEGDVLELFSGFGVYSQKVKFTLKEKYTLTYSGGCWNAEATLKILNLITSRDGHVGLYPRFNLSLYDTKNKWATLNYEGNILLNGETITPLLQVCEWDYDLCLNYIGKDNDVLILPKGLKVSVSGITYCLDEEYKFCFSTACGGWVIGNISEIGFEEVKQKISNEGRVINNALYIVEDYDIFTKTGSKAWDTLLTSGDLLYCSKDGNIKTLSNISLQVCGWDRNICLTNFGTADVGDKITFLKGFTIICRGQAWQTTEDYTYCLYDDGWALYKDNKYTISITGGSVDKSTATYGETVTLTFDDSKLTDFEEFVGWEVNGIMIVGNEFVIKTDSIVKAVTKSKISDLSLKIYKEKNTNNTMLILASDYDFIKLGAQANGELEFSGEITVNDKAVSGYKLKASADKCFYIDSLSVLDNDVLVIKKDSMIIVDGYAYKVKDDYIFMYSAINGWSNYNVVAFEDMLFTKMVKPFYIKTSVNIHSKVGSYKSFTTLGTAKIDGVVEEGWSIQTCTEEYGSYIEFSHSLPIKEGSIVTFEKGFTLSINGMNYILDNKTEFIYIDNNVGWLRIDEVCKIEHDSEIECEDYVKVNGVVNLSYDDDKLGEGQFVDYFMVNGEKITGNKFVATTDCIVSVVIKTDTNTYTVSTTDCKADKESAVCGTTITLSHNGVFPEHKEFDFYEVNGEKISGNTFVLIGNAEVKVVYRDIYYSISVTGGTADFTTAKYNTLITLTVDNIIEGKLFDYWLVNGVKVSGNTFEVTGEMIVEAVYKEDDTDYIVNLKGAVADITTAKYGTVITLTIDDTKTPENMVFDYFTVNGEKISGNTFTLKGNTSVEVVYQISTTGVYNVTVVGGSASKLSGTGTFNEESSSINEQGLPVHTYKVSYNIRIKVQIDPQYKISDYDFHWGLVDTQTNDEKYKTTASINYYVKYGDAVFTAYLDEFTYFNLLVEGGTSSSGTTTNITSAKKNTKISLTVDENAIPDYCCFDYWELNGSKITTNTFSLTQDSKVIAVYKENISDLTISAVLRNDSDRLILNTDIKIFELGLNVGDEVTFDGVIKVNGEVVEATLKVIEAGIQLLFKKDISLNDEVSMKDLTLFINNTKYRSDDEISIMYYGNGYGYLFSEIISLTETLISSTDKNALYVKENVNLKDKEKLTSWTDGVVFNGSITHNGVQFSPIIQQSNTKNYLYISGFEGAEIGSVIEISNAKLIINNTLYVLDKDYSFTYTKYNIWNVTDKEDIVLVLIGADNGISSNNIIYINGDSNVLAGGGFNNYETIKFIGTIKMNDEEKAFNVYAFELKAFYIGGYSGSEETIKASIGDKITISKDSVLIGKNGNIYVIDKEYNFVYTPTGWAIA